MSTISRSLKAQSCSQKTQSVQFPITVVDHAATSSSSSGSSCDDSTLSTHAPYFHSLHSPNLPHDQLQAYFKGPSPDRHPNSLLPTSEHNPRLVQLVGSRPHISLVHLLIKSAEDVIRIHSESPAIALPSPPATPMKGTFEQTQAQKQQPPSPPPGSVYTHPKWKPLGDFILNVIETSNAKVGTLVVTLVYLHRLKAKLPPMAQGMPCTRHRVFLAALVVAAKYLNDSTPKNKHWSIYSRVFETAEINLMEKQMLQLLNFDLRLTEEEVIEHVKPLLASRRQDTPKQASESAALNPKRDAIQMPITPPHDAVPTLRVRKTQSVSVPPEDLRQREADRVQATESTFVLKPVPTGAKKNASPLRNSAAALSFEALPTSELTSPSLSPSSSPSFSATLLAPPMAKSKSNSSTSSTASSSVASFTETSPDRGVIHIPEDQFLTMSLKEKRGFLSNSVINKSSPFNNEAFAPLAETIPTSASNPSLGGKLTRWIMPRRGRKATE